MNRNPLDEAMEHLRAEVMASPEGRREYERLRRLIDPSLPPLPIDPTEETLELLYAEVMATAMGRRVLITLLWSALLEEQIRARAKGRRPFPFWPPGG